MDSKRASVPALALFLETHSGSLLRGTILPSLPRWRESRKVRKDWIPAYAGMTSKTSKAGSSTTQKDERLGWEAVPDMDITDYIIRAAIFGVLAAVLIGTFQNLYDAIKNRGKK
jgi:hypothetical protein